MVLGSDTCAQNVFTCTHREKERERELWVCHCSGIFQRWMSLLDSSTGIGFPFWWNLVVGVNCGGRVNGSLPSLPKERIGKKFSL